MNQSEYILSDEAMEQNEERYHELAESLNDIVYWISADGVISYVSPAVEHLLGYQPEDLIDRNYMELIVPEDRDQVSLAFDDVLMAKASNGECRLLAKNGSIRWARISARPTVLYQKIIGVQGVMTDVTEQKLTEESLLLSLMEKEALVREVHHRVKNNFQAIIDLIASRLGQSYDEQTILLLKGLQEQVRTLALVHEQLSQSENLEQVEMRPYLHDLAASVVEAFGAGRSIEWQVECDDFSLQVRDAMPCGLIVNELLTNALKYAFPTSYRGLPRIFVKLSEEVERCDLLISDNGVGLPGELDQLISGSLGLKLARLWAVHQLGGTLELREEEGTAFHVTFRRRKANHRSPVKSLALESSQVETAPASFSVSSMN